MSTNDMGRVEADLAQLQATQATLSDAVGVHRRQEAANRRAQLEAGLKRTMDSIGTVREEVRHLQSRLAAMRASGAATANANAGGDSARFDQECRWLAQESKKKIEQLQNLVAKAKEETAFARPRIAWCLQVEAGTLASDEADIEAGLAEIGKEST